ncbi:MAG: NADH-quinone oxidoreductase subunit N [Bacteroidota bacterium]
MNALILISLLGISVLFAGIFNLKNKSIYLAVLGLIGALGLNCMAWGTDTLYYNDMVHFDNFALAFSSLMIVTTGLILLLGFHFYRNNEDSSADLFALMLFALVGGICLVSYNHLAVLFIGIEILSIPLYILAGSNRNKLASNEAGMKYFLMGAFTSGFLLMGIALVFVATGTFHLNEITQAISAGVENEGILMVGILLILSGFLFKVAAVPFHFWAPDVYEGSPTLVTGFMATIVKTAAFAGLYRLFQGSFASFEGVWYDALWVITALTLLAGNITALYQTGIKRLLAYSSISHAGYMMLAILALNTEAAGAIFFYSIAYSISTIAAFAILIAIVDLKGTDTLDSIRGLARRKPLLGFALAVTFLSLAGIPPMAGFIAKYFLFKTAIEMNLIWIVIVAVISSIIGAYYYLRVIAMMYQKEGDDVNEMTFGTAFLSVIAIAVAGTLVVGLFPEQLLSILK